MHLAKQDAVSKRLVHINIQATSGTTWSETSVNVVSFTEIVFDVHYSGMCLIMTL